MHVKMPVKLSLKFHIVISEHEGNYDHAKPCGGKPMRSLLKVDFYQNQMKFPRIKVRCYVIYFSHSLLSFQSKFLCGYFLQIAKE